MMPFHPGQGKLKGYGEEIEMEGHNKTYKEMIHSQDEKLERIKKKKQLPMMPRSS